MKTNDKLFLPMKQFDSSVHWLLFLLICFDHHLLLQNPPTDNKLILDCRERNNVSQIVPGLKAVTDTQPSRL